jgi:FAD/FMN-containing dehydrogenase
VSGLEHAVAGVVGASHVLADPELKAGYEVDWTGRYRGESRFVVRPADTDEVAAVVRLCAEAGVPMVHQGGRTSFVGGGVPRGGEVLVSLARLRGVEDVDEAASQVTAGAGATLADVQAAARRAGLFFPLDFGARDAATVGGALATNAGGNRAFRYGMARALAAGVEAVLPDGGVVNRLSGLPKDNAGYDLVQLLAGSEGTLGIITRARLRLTTRGASVATALAGVGSTEAAIELYTALRRRLPGLDAAELLYAAGLELVCAHERLRPPLPDAFPVYLLVEAAADEGALELLAEALDGLLDSPEHAVVADDAATRERLWRYREGHTEAVSARWTPLKLDVALPVSGLAAFVGELHRVLGAQAFLWGHAGDGNVHVNVVGLDPPEETRVTREVLELVARHGGSIGAEHGIGIAKREWLHLTRGPADLAAMRAVKAALDPAGLFNPGVLL